MLIFHIHLTVCTPLACLKTLKIKNVFRNAFPKMFHHERLAEKKKKRFVPLNCKITN